MTRTTSRATTSSGTTTSATADGEPRTGISDVPAATRFRSLDTVRFLLSPRYREDPYPLYDRLRNHERVHHASVGVTLVSGYDECLQVLKHPAASSNEANADLSFAAGRAGAGLVAEAPGRLIFKLADSKVMGTGSGAFIQLAERLLISMDPPDHTRIRGLASRAFTPNVVEKLRPDIEALAHRLLDELEPQGGAELLESYCYRLPVIVICGLLGVPVEDHERFGAWVPDVVAGLDAMAVASKKVRQRADAAAIALDRYLRALIDRHRLDPADDLLSALIAAADGEDRLSEDELVAFAALLLIAGHETTANLIGNGLWHLWRNADQFHRWRADTEVRHSGVEELLRYDSPVQLAERIPTEDIEIGDTTIAAGRFVMVMLGAANRDPQRFSSPERLDLGRDEGPSISFGFGIHHCIGAPLARAEAEVALSTLFDRLPRLRVTLDEPRWKPTMIFRGLRELPVRWD